MLTYHNNVAEEHNSRIPLTRSVYDVEEVVPPGCLDEG